MSGARKPKVNKWIVAGILVAIAVAIYVSILFKVAAYGP